MNSKNPILKFDHVTYFYPEQDEYAVKQISFDVQPGEFLVIMGRNGAGKTTISLMMNGSIPNVSGGRLGGHIVVNGMDTREHHVYEIAKHVGIVLQGPESQILTSLVRSEVAFAAENLGIPREETIKRVDWALEKVRLKGHAEDSPTDLSGGEKQRLAIAAALVMKPDILVLDEPTSQLDPIGTNEILSLLHDLKEQGKTIILTTHKSDEITNLADRIILLKNGEIVSVGKPHEIISQVDLLQEAGVKIPDVTHIEWYLRDILGNENLSIDYKQGLNNLQELLQGNPVQAHEDLTSQEASKSGDEPIVKFNNVTFYYGTDDNDLALNDLSIEIHQGEFVGIVGHNGAGKSTLVKHIVGLLKPQKGEVIVNHKTTSEIGIEELVKSVGLVLQNPDTQLFAISVEEEVAFGPKNLGLDKKKVEENINKALEATGLLEYKNVYPFNLSFGDRRKLSVAAVLSMDPDILIFDEPTTGQDIQGRRALADIGRQLNKKGKTVIMVTHDMDLIATYTKRLIVLREGSVLLDGKTSEVFANIDTLKKAFIEPPQVTKLAIALREFGMPESIVSPEKLAQYIRKAVEK